MATAFVPQPAPLLDDQWIVAIVDRIHALPETLADVTDPYNVGFDAGERGEPCEPLTHYAKLGDIENYIIGWKDATVAMKLAAEYADDMADADFFRYGC